jgi:hypothetical protein
METTSNVAQTTSDRELVLTRVFDAPRSLVYQACPRASPAKFLKAS